MSAKAFEVRERRKSLVIALRLDEDEVKVIDEFAEKLEREDGGKVKRSDVLRWLVKKGLEATRR